MRDRGAKVTDIIILVVSAIEGIQKQTVEVIELAKKYKIPTVVAINKIDRAPEFESVLLDLNNHGLVPEQLGGSVKCVGISAKLKQNMDKLEDSIITLADQELNLMEDFSMNG